MRTHDAIATSGGVRANEDRVGHAGNLAWVIDGCTDLYDNAALPAENDVQWLVDTVAGQLQEAGEEAYHGDGPALLEHIAHYVGERMINLGFPDDRVPPACSLAVAVDFGDVYEITRIGDATGVVAGAAPALLNTGFFDEREARAVDAACAGSPPNQVAAGKQARRLETMTAGGAESIFSGHPKRVLRSHRLRGGWSRTSSVLLCTDGFARLVTDYDTYEEWDELMHDALDKGLAYLEKRLRDTEADPASAPPRRFKRADDAAAVLLLPAR
jgi:hypothetical protein